MEKAKYSRFKVPKELIPKILDANGNKIKQKDMTVEQEKEYRKEYWKIYYKLRRKQNPEFKKNNPPRRGLSSGVERSLKRFLAWEKGGQTHKLYDKWKAIQQEQECLSEPKKLTKINELKRLNLYENK